MSASSEFHLQLLATAVAATLLGALPPLRSYQLYKEKAFDSMSVSEKRITAMIFIAITLLHIGEAFKGVAFSMLFYSQSNFLGIITFALIANCSTLITEVGRILIIHAIISRAAEFLMRPIDTPATRTRSVIWLRIIGGIRIAIPILVAIGGITPSLFGSFAAIMLATDAIICTIISVAIALRINERRRKELLPAISNYVLYSNAIVTFTIAFSAVITMAIIGAANNGQFGGKDQSDAFVQCLPSVHASIVGILMCYAFWNVKEILATNSPTGTSPRRANATGLGRNVFTF